MASKIEEILIHSLPLDELQVQGVHSHLKQWGGRFANSVAELGLAREEKVVDVLAAALRCRQYNLDAVEKDEAALAKVEATEAREKGLFPVALEDHGKSLLLAMADPTDLTTVDALAGKTRLRIKTVVAGEQAIRRAIDVHYFGREGTPAPKAFGTIERGQPSGDEEEEFKLVDFAGKTINKSVQQIFAAAGQQMPAELASALQSPPAAPPGGIPVAAPMPAAYPYPAAPYPAAPYPATPYPVAAYPGAPVPGAPYPYPPVPGMAPPGYAPTPTPVSMPSPAAVAPPGYRPTPTPVSMPSPVAVAQPGYRPAPTPVSMPSPVAVAQPGYRPTPTPVSMPSPVAVAQPGYRPTPTPAAMPSPVAVAQPRFPTPVSIPAPAPAGLAPAAEAVSAAGTELDELLGKVPETLLRFTPEQMVKLESLLAQQTKAAKIIRAMVDLCVERRLFPFEEFKRKVGP